MSLYLEANGRGPSVVLLHGWGLHGGVWQSTVDALKGNFQTLQVDLPGFGHSPALARPERLEAIAAAVAEAVPPAAVWVGWSLGGMVALAAAAARLGRPRALVLVGTNARFVQDPGWSHGVAREVLDGFASALAEDYRATVLRFLALQARGSQHAREELRRLREEVFVRGEPARPALEGGLAILARADLRDALNAIDIPVLVVQGERDTLVPAPAAEFLAQRLPQGRLARLPGAGHAPFISHPEAFLQVLQGFLDE